MRTIRRPTAAGQNSFYPANAVELTKMIASFFAEVEKAPIPGRPIGLIAPHAGYLYSGKVAAKAFKLLEGEQYERVIVISPSHQLFFKGCAIYPGEAYQTPLGDIEIDQAMANQMIDINPLVYYSNNGHATGSDRGEHSLEVLLPFLQIALGEFKLLPIVMGDQETESVSALAELLSSKLRGTNSLIVASTDLSHFHSQKEAGQLDGQVKSAIEAFDPKGLMSAVSSGKGEACGAGPVAAMLQAARRLGGTDVTALDYATSGEVTGDFSEVVGYYSAIVTGDKKVQPERGIIGQPKAMLRKPTRLTKNEKKLLRQIAREAVGAKLNREVYHAPEVENLAEHKGAFVTLMIDGELRGCIGQIRASKPLYQTIADMAEEAAFSDPRFEPLTQIEFDNVKIEISVLTPLERVSNFDQIEIGRHGLMIKLGYNSGLLLPQVATDRDWTVTQFLEQTCLKAGLSKNTYKEKQTEVYKFSAEVF